MKKRIPNRPGLLDDAQRLAQAGRNGDKIVAHITPEEAQLLAARGGAGTRNPKTGLLEFYDSEPGMGSEGSGTTGGSVGSDGGGGFWDRVNDPSASVVDAPAPGPQGGGGQIADYTNRDLISLGYNPNDYAQSPTLGQYVGNFFAGIGDKIGAKLSDMARNPGATATNLGLGLLSPAYTVANGLYGAFTGKDFGKGIVGGIADMTNYNPDTQEATTRGAINSPDGPPDGPPGNGSESTGWTLGPMAQQTAIANALAQQTPEQVAQQALRQAVITAPPPNYWVNKNFNVGTNAGKPAAYNWWDQNTFRYPTGILG